MIAQADRSGINGRRADARPVAATDDWPAGPESGLDLAYPLGGLLTRRLLHGDPRKIVLAPATTWPSPLATIERPATDQIEPASARFTTSSGAQACWMTSVAEYSTSPPERGRNGRRLSETKPVASCRTSANTAA